MNTFSWLLLGHLIGDWVFQSDWMAKGKRQSLVTAPGLLHFLTYTAVIVGILWLSGSVDKPFMVYLILGFIIFITHWLIDATNFIEIWMRFAGQRPTPMVRVVVDQSFHILVLVLIIILFLQG